MIVNWNTIRRTALILFCSAAAAGSVRTYYLGTASQEVAVLYEEPLQSIAYLPSADLPDERLDLNIASLEQLCTLNGIGPVKAQAILDYRDMYGGFVCVEELMEVKGIGESTYNKIKDYLYIRE